MAVLLFALEHKTHLIWSDSLDWQIDSGEGGDEGVGGTDYFFFLPLWHWDFKTLEGVMARAPRSFYEILSFVWLELT